MKTAEEWLETFVKTDNMIRGRLDLIRDIQSDALREAAEIAGRVVVRDMECVPSFNDGVQAGRNEAKNAILAKAKEIE